MSRTWAEQMLWWCHIALAEPNRVLLPYSGIELVMWLGSRMNETFVYNQARSQTVPGEWVESWKEDTIHDAITAQTLPKGRPLILSTEGSPASRSAWPASGPEPLTNATAGLSSDGSCGNCGHDGSWLRMSRDFYPSLVDGTSEVSSAIWMNSGSMSRGRYWTRSTSESRSAAAACSLLAVLEAEVPSKFYLSAKAAAGILRRAERRGKSLPTHLQQALEALATATETLGTAPT